MGVGGGRWGSVGVGGGRWGGGINGSRLREVAARLSPSTTLPGELWAALVTARAALPQIRVETLIDSQAEFEIAN